MRLPHLLIVFAHILLLSNPAGAESVPSLTLPDTATLSRWLAQDPALQQADSQWHAQRELAQQTARSGYEWNASYSQQRRRYEAPELAGAESHEWNLELERSLRLPGKGSASRRQADALRQQGDALHRLAMRSAVAALADQYLDCLEASVRWGLLNREQGFAKTNLNTVEQRVQAGDAPALDARLAAAELQSLERELEAARQQASSLWLAFQRRYPAAELPAIEQYLARPEADHLDPMLLVPHPQAPTGDWHSWRARLLAQHPALQEASSRVLAARAASDLARRERLPDPSLALYSGREAFGNETIIGLRLRVPLPGGQRQSHMRQRYAEEHGARAERELIQRKIEADLENLYWLAKSEYKRWQLAQEIVQHLGENVRLLHKAYRLGEQDLQGLLLGQQQYTRAALAEAESRILSLGYGYHLQLAAGELDIFPPSPDLSSLETAQAVGD